MDSRNRIDRAALDRVAGELRQHPAFADAKLAFCTGVTDWWLGVPINRALMSDTGAIAVAVTITGLSRTSAERGASLQTVIDALSAGGLASATRIRAMIDILAAKGAVAITPHPSDKRRLVIAPTEVMLESLRLWLRAVLDPVARLFDLPAAPDEIAAIPGIAERYFTTVMLRSGVDGFSIFDNWPEAQVFSDRRQGYVLMLHLAAATGAEMAVPRAALAARYFVSASQITALLVEAERHGWLERLPGGMVRLTPVFADRLELWVAREIAVVGMWVEQKLAPRPA
ncbi:helix-turn-helix domain-containing protein [Glacieibacterium frigidum]|uniref:Uncharacterized protein n=1 Tax=Glacieibacterium frigidum TaxID=2593303 RepID=A0A552UH32_9SPHN|nr:hypothetical protein [Glacieibacterium frigidum]TRW17520.1 hypothetical protein FMM06_05015 [Glacieibacterium frigidum]